MAWACVCSNSSSLIGLVVGMWNRDMITTLLHSLRTIPMAEILSSLVSRELNVKSSYWLSNGYSVMSTLQPENKKADFTCLGTAQNLTLFYFFNNEIKNSCNFQFLDDNYIKYNLHTVVMIFFIFYRSFLWFGCAYTFLWYHNICLLWLRYETKSERIILHRLIKDDAVHGSAEVNVHLLLKHL